MDFTSCTEKKKGKKGFYPDGLDLGGGGAHRARLSGRRHWAGPVTRPHARRGHVDGGLQEIRLRAREAVKGEGAST